MAIISADFLGFPAMLGDQVRTCVKGIPPQNILIGATHTHSAPDCYGFPDGKGGTASDPKYLASVCAKMTEAIKEAVTKLQPAQLKIATGEAKGKIAYNYYAEQLLDPRCSVIQALDESGRPFATPNMDALAANGLRYNNMHTTALCSPTRACILTGRNHHSNAMACITEGSTGFPGYNANIPFENGFPLGNPAGERLQHLSRRQMASDPRRPDLGCRSV